MNKVPDAMMIKLSYTHFTDGAMFRACWFDDVTGFAFVVFAIDDFVVMGVVFINLSFVVLLGDLSGGDCAGFVVDPEAD